MKHTNHFLISPKDSILLLLQDGKYLNFFELSQPVMWSGDEHDKSSLSHIDFDVVVKILFLDVLRRELGKEPGFEILFPDFLISESYFDSFWSLQRIPLDMSVEIALKDALISGTFEELKAAGNEKVSEWFSAYKAG